MQNKPTRKSTTNSSPKHSHHLYYFPLSCIILDGATRLIPNENDLQLVQEEEPQLETRKSVARSKSTVSGTFTNDSSSTCSSPSQMTVDSSMTFTEYGDGRSFNVQCMCELRARFQSFLKDATLSGGGNSDYLIKLHKLMFLDEFYDPTRNRRKKLENCEALFRACEQYLTLIHVQSKNSLNFSLLDSYPYLNNFEEMQKIQPDNSILKNHEYLVQWFKKQSQNLKRYTLEGSKLESGGETILDESAFLSYASPTMSSSFVTSPTLSVPGGDPHQAQPQDSSLEEYLDENELKMLIHMFSTELEDYFALFQKSNGKYMKKWLEVNAKSLPSFVIDSISKKRKKYLHFHEKYKLTEEDLNMKTIVDSDFDFIQYLGEHTEDWTVLSTSPLITGYKSKENYCKFTEMKLQKFITTVNYSIEKVLKTALSNVEDIGSENMIESSEYHHYTEIDPSISSRKYASVIQTSLWNYGSIFKKRSLENAMSTKANFCGNELQDAIHLYKTCTYVSKKTEDSKAPIKIIVFGGRIYSRMDSNQTRVTDIRMFNFGGMFSSFDFVFSNKLVVKFSVNGITEYFEKRMKKAQDEEFPSPDNSKLVWRTFSDYCRVHRKVDVSLW